MNDNTSAADDVRHFIEAKMEEALAHIQDYRKKLQEAQKHYDGYKESLRRHLQDGERQQEADARPPTPSRSPQHSQSLPASSEYNSTLDEGCMTLNPNEITDPNSWIDLVHDKSIVYCPYCRINASIRQQDGRTWIAYYKGIQGFVTHVNISHKQEFLADYAKNPKYRGKAGKTERLKDAMVAMTREQRAAYHRQGEGYRIPPVVVINAKYKCWLNLKQQTTNGEPSRSPPPPRDADTINCIPQADKRQREDQSSSGVTGSNSRVPGTFTAVNERSSRKRAVDVPAPVFPHPGMGERKYVDLSEDHDEEQERKRVFTEDHRDTRASVYSDHSMYRDDSIIPPTPAHEVHRWRY